MCTETGAPGRPRGQLHIMRLKSVKHEHRRYDSYTRPMLPGPFNDTYLCQEIYPTEFTGNNVALSPDKQGLLVSTIRKPVAIKPAIASTPGTPRL